ncbi:MAG: CopG family transcriptional regulator [Thermofilaceae archaeon]
MDSVVSFRVPLELKRKMDELRGKINWSEELRKFVERRVQEYEQVKTIRELEEAIMGLPSMPRGTAVGYVREDRDSN